MQWCYNVIKFFAKSSQQTPHNSPIRVSYGVSVVSSNFNVYIQKPTSSGVEWAECSLIIGTGYWVQGFSLLLNSSVSLWVGIQSAVELVSETSQLRILHSPEEDNLSPFGLKVACLCQSIEINNKYVYVCSFTDEVLAILTNCITFVGEIW